MGQYNLQRKTDPRDWEVLQGNFDFESNRIAGWETEQKAARVSHARDRLRLMQHSFEALREINPLAIESLIAVRRELGVDTDIEKFTGIMDSVEANTAANLDKFQQDLNTLIAQSEQQA